MLLNPNQDYIEYLIIVGFYWVKWVVDTDAGLDRNFLLTPKSNLNKKNSFALISCGLRLTETRPSSWEGQIRLDRSTQVYKPLIRGHYDSISRPALTKLSREDKRYCWDELINQVEFKRQWRQGLHLREALKTRSEIPIVRKDQVLSCYTLNCNCGGRGLGLIAQVRVGGATQGQAVWRSCS